jgi:hypothetical protein
MQEQRRTFLKLAAAGVTGLALGRAKPARAAWPKTGTLAINPNISNMLVVGCKDETMLKNTPSSMTFATQTAAVDSARVAANLDAMAMRLADSATPDEAWKAIFRSSKPWASTLVAIKVNVTEVKNMPRLAVVEKLCRVMAGLGVPASNIIVYDGGLAAYASATSNYVSYFSTTDKAKIPGVVSNLNDALGGTIDAPLPDGTSAACTADIASGKVDIIINIAINKGHIYYGKASLCMKNHYGTFAPDHGADYLFTVNKSDALVGGTPPRQQLCIVDSLFANKTFNTAPEAMPYYLVMGTFAPAVDYLAVKKIREEVLKYSHDSAIIDQYLTEFGYTAKDPQWVLLPPAATGGAGGAGGSTGAGGRTGAGGGGGSGGASQTAGSGGGKTGGTKGSGGTGGGGATSSGGSGGTGGIGGTSSASGGAQGTGGTTNIATSGSGGALGSGGTMSSGGALGSGGAGGSGSSSAWATGGATANAGSTGGAQAQSRAGCNCRIGGARGGVGGVGVTLLVGTLLVARLKGMLLQRQSRTEPPTRRR